jgi:hypothetical protein
MSTKKQRGRNVCFVVPLSWVREVNAIVKRKHYIGKKLNKSDILRAAMRKGLDAIAQDETVLARTG